jgi:hypothetical protein
MLLMKQQASTLDELYCRIYDKVEGTGMRVKQIKTGD